MPDAYFEDGSQERYQETSVGSGANGSVYLSLNNQHVAKIFNVADRHKQQRLHDLLRLVITQYNVVQGHPYWSRLFAWPDKIVTRFGSERLLGVRMARSPLPPVAKSIDLIKQYAFMEPSQRGWWIGRVAIALKLARAISFLEKAVLAHTDISPNNVFGDPFTGEMTLIDCDGIVSPGTQLVAQVLGTDGYIAPELLAKPAPGAKMDRTPTRYTDRHALAVMLYQLLLYRHPLKGPKRHPTPAAVSPEEEDRYLLAEGAVYIEDPVDRSNHPPGRLIPSATLGSFVEGLFEQAFVGGLHRNPGSRPTAAEWEDALTRLYDRVVPCVNPACPQRFFAAPDNPGQRLICPLCQHELTGPTSIPYVELRRYEGGLYKPDQNYIVVGWPGRHLHAWHLATDVKPIPEDGTTFNPEPVARFEYDTDIEEWYLVNLGLDKLLITGEEEYVPIGTRVLLEDEKKMWLSGASTSRLAIVDIRSMTSSSPVFCLPAEVVGVNVPWPTFAPTANDGAWQPGEQISLPQNPTSVILDPPPPPSQRSLAGTIAAFTLYCIIAGWLVGSAIPLWTFWTTPPNLLIATICLVGGGVVQYFLGLRIALWVWGAMGVALFIQGITYIVPSSLVPALTTTAVATFIGVMALLTKRMFMRS